MLVQCTADIASQRLGKTQRRRARGAVNLRSPAELHQHRLHHVELLQRAKRCLKRGARCPEYAFLDQALDDEEGGGGGEE